MALIHTQHQHQHQHHPFYYPPHAPFLFHSHHQQPKAPLPLPTSPPLSPPPSSSSITIKMAHAPPFIPHQLSSPRPLAPDVLRLPPLLPAAPTDMAHASFFLRSCPPPPMPHVSPALLHQVLEMQRPPAVPDTVHQAYFFYQHPYPLAHPALSAAPSPRVPPPTAFYYAPAAASLFGGEAAPTKVDPSSTQLEDGEEPINGFGAGGRGRAARGKVGGTLTPTTWRSRLRKCTWSWVTKEEAERRRRLVGLNVRRSPAATSSSSPSSSSDSPSASTIFSASSSADSPAPPLSLELDETLAEQDARTTLMIRNIPNKYRRELLMKLLDDHCVEVNDNKVVEPGSALPPDAPPSEYDFVYLPMDFRTNSCMGYAFVNFTTPAAAWRLHRALNNHKWDNMFGTKKIAHICYARIQGKEAMLANFGGSSFRCDSDEYLPVTFSPPRSGAAPCPPPTLVGKRWPRGTNIPTAAAAAAASRSGNSGSGSSSSSSTGYL